VSLTGLGLFMISVIIISPGDIWAKSPKEKKEKIKSNFVFIWRILCGIQLKYLSNTNIS
jgi:hypothetical protein